MRNGQIHTQDNLNSGIQNMECSIKTNLTSLILIVLKSTQLLAVEIVQLFVVIVNITKSLDLGPNRFTVASDSSIKRIEKSLLLDKFLRTKLRVRKKSMNDLSL